MSLKLLPLLIFSLIHSASAQTPPEAEKVDLTTPANTYGSYLHAIKKNNADQAKLCVNIPDNQNAELLDTLVQFWIACRLFNDQMIKTFGKEVAENSEFFRDDVTDEAIGITLERLEASKSEIKGDHATLQIRWAEDDGYPDPAFEFSGENEPRYFLKMENVWKMISSEDPEEAPNGEIFTPGSVTSLIRGHLTLATEATTRLSEGRIATMKDLETFTEARGRELMEPNQPPQK